MKYNCIVPDTIITYSFTACNIRQKEKKKRHRPLKRMHRFCSLECVRQVMSTQVMRLTNTPNMGRVNGIVSRTIILSPSSDNLPKN